MNLHIPFFHVLFHHIYTRNLFFSSFNKNRCSQHIKLGWQGRWEMFFSLTGTCVWTEGQSCVTKRNQKISTTLSQLLSRKLASQTIVCFYIDSCTPLKIASWIIDYFLACTWKIFLEESNLFSQQNSPECLWCLIKFRKIYFGKTTWVYFRQVVFFFLSWLRSRKGDL